MAALWAKDLRRAPVWEVAPAERWEEFDERTAALKQGDLKTYHREFPLDQALARVPALVDDAISTLIQYGIPLFRQAGSQRCLQWRY